MKCLNCNNETNNPKFCCRSCAAKFNNKLHPKRKPEGSCKICKKLISTQSIFCSSECRAIYFKNKEPSERRKTCSFCGILKTTENSFSKNNQSYCKKCNSIKTAIRSRKFKIKCVEYKGGKCEKCGYDKCNAALEFHHKDPEKKDFGIASQKTRSLNEKVKLELDKCDLLCSNCHREEHERLYAERNN